MNPARYQRGATPFHLSFRGGEWRIGYGVSSFLVAKGSGWSRPMAATIKQALDREFRTRKLKRKAPNDRTR